jgi:hypothetical protein
MGSVPLSETIKDLKVVLFIAKKTELILMDEVALRGFEGTLRAFDRVEEVKRAAQELLNTLENTDG